ncbi:MAG: hypothetical protein ACTSR2_12860, partial [Candidatus Hodarchaeales archaeon]
FKETGAIKGELESIQSNLQFFLNEDDLFVDNLKKKMTIKKTQLDFRFQNRFLPCLSFLIISDEFNVRNKSKFQVELHTQPEKLPYPAIAVWRTRIGKFEKVISQTFHEVHHSGLEISFHMNTGDIIGGKEQFTLSTKM